MAVRLRAMAAAQKAALRFMGQFSLMVSPVVGASWGTARHLPPLGPFATGGHEPFFKHSNSTETLCRGAYGIPQASGEVLLQKGFIHGSQARISQVCQRLS